MPHERKPSIPKALLIDVAIILAILLVPIALAFALSGQFTTLSVEITVEKPIRDENGNGRAHTMTVQLENTGARSIIPHLFVFWHGVPNVIFVHWPAANEGAPIAPGGSESYTIHIDEVALAVPDGATFFLRIYDAVSKEYVFSEPETLRIMG